MSAPATHIFAVINYGDIIRPKAVIAIDLTRPMSQGLYGREDVNLEGTARSVTMKAGRPTWSFFSYMKSIMSFEDMPCKIMVTATDPEKTGLIQHTLLEEQDCLVTLQDRDHYTIKFADFDAPQMMDVLSKCPGLIQIPFPKPPAQPEPPHSASVP